SLCRTSLFSFHHTSTTQIYTLSLHDALPISNHALRAARCSSPGQRSSARPHSREQTRARFAHDPAAAAPKHETLSRTGTRRDSRSEEHTSELQSPCNLVCRLLLEKKKKTKNI